ncbi:hypothetical protein FQR65_LT14036 [Abscondita terminalis]|nr:hypothetical protein FQR65_LT14036 [Abscondita terminalis]
MGGSRKRTQRSRKMLVVNNAHQPTDEDLNVKVNLMAPINDDRVENEICNNGQNENQNSTYELSVDDDKFYENDDEGHLPLLQFEVDVDRPKTLADVVKGRRVVDVAHLLTQYETIVSHKFRCTMGKMQILKEQRVGLFTTLHFYCDNCEKTAIITSEQWRIYSRAEWA